MKKFILLFSILCYFINVHSQEVQVPFFKDSNILIIDKKMASKSNLFDNYPSFEFAKLFKNLSQVYILEISYTKDDLTYKERIEMTESEKNEFIDGLKLKLSKSEKTFDLNQSGRTAYLVGSTLTGLSFYGPAIPTMLSIEDSKSFAAMYMLTAGGGFALNYLLTRDIEVSRPQASMAFYGQSRGIGHGMLTALAFNEEVEIETLMGMGTLFSIGEGIAGFKLAKKWNYSRGDASMFQLGGDIGASFGYVFGDIFGFMDYDYYANIEEKPSHMATSVLLGNAIGLVGGKFLGDLREHTIGDAIIIRANMGLGILAANTLIDYFDPEDATPYLIGSMIGSTLGGIMGYKSLKGKDFSLSHSVMIGLGELAGGLIGLGTGYLIAPDDNLSPYLLTFSTIGAVAGYGILFNHYSKKIEINEKEDFMVNISLNPIGFSSLMNNNKLPMNYIPTMAGLNITF